MPTPPGEAIRYKIKDNADIIVLEHEHYSGKRNKLEIYDETQTELYVLIALAITSHIANFGLCCHACSSCCNCCGDGIGNCYCN